VRCQESEAVDAKEVLAAERSGNWDTELAVVAAGTAGTCQEQMAAGVFPRRSKQKANSPAEVVAAAGIAGAP
jgi:hypothetical protein